MKEKTNPVFNYKLREYDFFFFLAEKENLKVLPKWKWLRFEIVNSFLKLLKLCCMSIRCCIVDPL